MSETSSLRRLGDLPLSGFLASGFVAAALIGGTYWMSLQEQRARSWVSHTEQVLAAVAATRSRLVDLQNGVRGFVISGVDGDLAPYEAARATIWTDARHLKQLTADDPAQQENVRQLEGQLEPRIAAAEAVIAARRAGGFDAAKAILDRGQPAQEQLRARRVLEAMEAAERRLLAQRLSRHEAGLRAFWAAMAMLPLGLVAVLSTLYVQIRRKRSLQQTLLEREQEFHLMTDSVTEYAILMLDLQGKVRTWNPGAQRIKGYRTPDIVGRHFSCFYSDEDVRTGKPAESLRLAREAGVYTGEGWHVRKDGSRFWGSIVITPVRRANGEVTGFCKITRDLSERRRAEERLRHEMNERTRIDEELQRVNAGLEALVEERTRELRSTNLELAASKDRLETLSKQLLSAQEEERRHIARELHDETGQALTLIRLNLTELMQRQDGAEGRAAGCIQHVDRAISHIRGLSVRLRPPMLDDLGLADAIEWLLEQQGRAAGWRVETDLPEMAERLPEQIETACFRICQEALTNAARYAKASEVSVTLRSSGPELVMAVADNGTGFDLQRYRSVDERKKHFGLVSMTERAALAGGELEIDTAPGRGTEVRARFRLHETACAGNGHE